MARGDDNHGPSTSRARGRGQQHTYEAGSKVLCTASFDYVPHPAEVLEAKPSENRYYVHYLEMDKRMDEWVTGDKLTPFTGTPRGQETASALPAVGTELISPSGDAQKVTRRLKRKMEEYHHVVADPLEE